MRDQPLEAAVPDAVEVDLPVVGDHLALLQEPLAPLELHAEGVRVDVVVGRQRHRVEDHRRAHSFSSDAWTYTAPLPLSSSWNASPEPRPTMSRQPSAVDSLLRHVPVVGDIGLRVHMDRPPRRDRQLDHPAVRHHGDRAVALERRGEEALAGHLAADHAHHTALGAHEHRALLERPVEGEQPVGLHVQGVAGEVDHLDVVAAVAEHHRAVALDGHQRGRLVRHPAADHRPRPP